MNTRMTVASVVVAFAAGGAAVFFYLGTTPWTSPSARAAVVAQGQRDVGAPSGAADVTLSANSSNSASTSQQPLSDRPSQGQRVPDSQSGSANFETVPAWLSPRGNDAAPRTSYATPQQPQTERKREQVLAALAKLNRLQADPVAGAKELSETIAELERANGSSTMHGVKLDVLRTNLAISQKIEVAVKELEDIRTKSEGRPPTPEFEAKLKEVQALQRQLRTDFLVSRSVP